MSRSIFIIFIFILIFSPLAFGTVEPWSLTIMETSCFLAFFIFLLRNIRDKKSFLYEIPGIIPLTFLLAFILLQLVPLPAEMVKIISPGTYNIYKDTIFADQQTRWISLSINTKQTLSEFFRIASYVVFYVLTIQLLTNKDNLIKTIAVVVVFASLLSLFGILQHILFNNKIYWIRELSQGGTPFGPYVNRNHYAGLMGMLLPVVLSLFLFYKPSVANTSLRERIIELFNKQWTNTYLLLGFSAVLIGTSIFLTLSRSGIVSLCLSMIVYGLIFLSRGTNKKRAVIIIVIFMLVVLSVGWFGWSPIFERFEKIRNPQGDISEMRIEVWKDSLKIIREFPLVGTGFGSFINIYPKYRTIPGDSVADHAHNDYIEVLVTGGFVTLMIFTWFLIALLYKTYRVFLKRHETYSIYLFIGSVTGIISILLHSITDFNLYIGANGLYFFFLSGLVVSAANSRLRDGLHDTYLRKTSLPHRFLVPVIFIFMIAGFIFQTGVTIGKYYFSSIRDVKLNEDISRNDLISLRDKAYRASFFDPLESQYQYAVANIEKLISQNEVALNAYRRAVQLNPVNSEYLQRFGLLLSEFKHYDKAEKFLMAGIEYDPDNPMRYKRYALWLFALGRKDDGIKVMQEAISLEPQKTREYITIMVLNRLSDEDILRALPERVEPHLLFADYLYRTGKDSMAEGEYLNALKYLKNENKITPAFFYSVYNYYMKKVLHADALSIMRQAAESLPDDAGIRIRTGELYEKLNLTHKAAEEYKQALVIDPKNEGARKRLSNILSKNKNQ